MEREMNDINDLNDIRALVAFSKVNGEDPSGLMKFLQSELEVEKIKENPKRAIFRMADEHGRVLFLKLFRKQRFPFNIFRFYAAKEYRIAKTLQKASLPIVNYLAWAVRKDGGGFCVSEGIPDALSGRRYFFETARFDARKRRVFLDRLAELTCALCKAHFYHPDFHTSNFLFDTKNEKAYLVDPWGIREVFFLPEFRRLEMCFPWMELRDCLTDDEIMQGLLSSSLAENKFAALELMERAGFLYRKQQELRWPKIRRRILSGKAKFATLEMHGNDRFFWRHTDWFTPPDKFEIDPAWEKREFPDGAEAEKIWLDSFRKYPDPKPMLWFAHPGGSAELYFTSKSNTSGR